MFKAATVCFCVVFAGALAIFSAEAIYAQELAVRQERGEHNLIVGEMLDKIEKDLDSAAGDNGLFAEAKGADVVELEFNISALPESGNLEEALETRVIPLLHADASDLMGALSRIKSPVGKITYNKDERTLILKDESQQLEAMNDFVKMVDIPLETKTFKLEHVKAYNILGNVKGILTEDIGKVQFGAQANSIVVTDTPVKIKEISGFIKKIDRTNKNILFETRVLQIVLNDEHPTGIDWGAIVSNHQSLAFSGFGIKRDGKHDERLSLGTVSQEDYGILVEALDMVGSVHTISQENIMAENETVRTLSIFPSLARGVRQDNFILAVSETSKNTNPSTEMWKGKEVRFHLIPTIERDEVVTVSVVPELIQGSAGLSPIVSESGLSLQGAMIQVENGATVVIGSLFEEVMTKTAWKIPLLGDLPLLGAVFRNQEEELRTAEIIAFLTVKPVEKER